MPEINKFIINGPGALDKKNWIILQSYSNGNIKILCPWCKFITHMNHNHLFICGCICGECTKLIENPLHWMFHHDDECYFACSPEVPPVKKIIYTTKLENYEYTDTDSDSE